MALRQVRLFAVIKAHSHETQQTASDSSAWEKLVVAQLYKEYQHILWQHRVSLRPVAIELFDSHVLWGRWNPLTRTISLARSLITLHPWFHVRGILRHEMAHQMAEEHFKADQLTDQPHGVSFLLACSRLGVSELFKKASIELQETSLDWKQEPQDGELEKLLNKVQKLLALGTSSNEHEALLAMNKVRELYAKYNLSQVRAGTSQSFVHAVICHKKQRIETHQKRIISILIEHFFVEAITFGMFDPRSGKEHRAVDLIGTRENVLMAEYVYYFLLQQSEYWVCEAVRVSGRSMSRVGRNSFRLGLLEGFSHKLQHVETHCTAPLGRSLINNDGGASEGRSLIRQAALQLSNDPQLQNYLKQSYPRLSHGSGGGHLIDHSAFVAGQEVGQKITLKKPIAHATGSLGLMLE